MDTKALARSKRAHSQHNNKKFHPNPKSKSQSTATPAPDANSKKKDPPGKQVTEKPRKPQLPSNWDRYEDELDPSLQAVSNQGTSKEKEKDSDVVLPKSKGADFSYLLSEAQSQLQSHTSDSLTRFASFDDVLPDFNQGISSMLSVRGNGILSWIGNDNFIVDDSSATTNEASFLSLDLHALATELEKIDVSRRLFIEADLLPPPLDADGMKPKTHGSELLQQNPDESSGYRQDPGKKIRTSQNDSIGIERSTLGEDIDSVDVKEEKTSKLEFEAVAAEAELDMLLNSFSDIKLPDDSSSSGDLPRDVEITDTVDDLLRETTNTDRVFVPPHVPTSSNPSVVLDDFDSWLDTI